MEHALDQIQSTGLLGFITLPVLALFALLMLSCITGVAGRAVLLLEDLLSVRRAPRR